MRRCARLLHIFPYSTTPTGLLFTEEQAMSTTAVDQPTLKALVSPVPPLAAAIAQAFNSDFMDGRVHPDFVTAWNAAPAIAAASALGHNDSADHVNRFMVIEQMFRARVAASQTGAEGSDSNLFAAVDLLVTEDGDDEYLTAIQSAMESPAFHVGLALGIYLTLNGGGAR
jgi:hypothetical protein